jgi:hypothetical protein
MNYLFVIFVSVVAIAIITRFAVRRGPSLSKITEQTHIFEVSDNKPEDVTAAVIAEYARKTHKHEWVEVHNHQVCRTCGARK